MIGPPTSVLLLHGQPGSARDWTRVVAALQGRAAAFAVDRPGWGADRPATDLPGNAAAAIDALDARGLQQAVVVGHSLGAAIAAWLAAEHPERVSALVLAAPAANVASLDWVDRWLTLPLAGAVSSAVSLTALGLTLSAGPVRRRIARRGALNEGYLQASGRMLLSSRIRRAFDVEQRALVRQLPELEPRLARIRAPTWVVSGSADRIVAPEAARRLAEQVPHARLVMLEGAGHLLPQRHAEQLAETILDAAGATH